MPHKLPAQKTGACPEDCNYCPQLVRYETEVKAEPLMAVDKVVEQAGLAKQQGATRFCMGAAWRSPKDRDLDQVIKMVQGVKAALMPWYKSKARPYMALTNWMN